VHVSVHAPLIDTYYLHNIHSAAVSFTFLDYYLHYFTIDASTASLFSSCQQMRVLVSSSSCSLREETPLFCPA